MVLFHISQKTRDHLWDAAEDRGQGFGGAD